MAPERPSRTGGFGLPGMRNSALAAAALSSVAVLAQSADAAPGTADEGPSREAVRQRVNSLYDQAESDTGQWNFTRPTATGSRGRGTPAGAGRRSDPDVDNVSRQWFDMARNSLGPTVPAALPASRTPDRRPAAPRPARSADRPLPARTGFELEAAGRPAAELPAGGPRRPLPELPAGDATAVLPAVPAQRQESAMAAPATGAEPRQTSLRRSKEQSQRKIAAASELLYRYTARQTSMAQPAVAPQTPIVSPPALAAPMPAGQQPAAAAASAAAPWSEQASRAVEEAWRLQQPSVLDTGVQPTQQWTPQQSPLVDTGASNTQQWALQQPTAMPTTQAVPQQASVLDTGALSTQQWASPAVGAQPSSALDASLPVSDQWRRLQEPSVLDTGVPEAVAEPPVGSRADRAVSFARAQIGRPCLWGGVGPESYDNAGLTQAAWKAAGVALPRSTHEQASIGTVIPLAESRPGDLIFFNDNFSHVGLYTGNGMMVHAPGPGAVIREESVHYAGEAAIRIAVRPA
ncbi:C40 family peptidase [Streptomyces sp. NPDC101152]|uniref:C40 family peptidase n=1 Tax=Streptomyces sp. NPDC101152 TaxID=3366116 RepID=UPI0037F1E248